LPAEPVLVLKKIIEPKNVAAGVARRHIFGFYMDRFLLGVPLKAVKLIKLSLMVSNVSFT
jgi:hypothetical protein